jgi:hypothetical protein
MADPEPGEGRWQIGFVLTLVALAAVFALLLWSYLHPQRTGPVGFGPNWRCERLGPNAEMCGRTDVPAGQRPAQPPVAQPLRP